MNRAALRDFLLRLYGGAGVPDLALLTTADWAELDRLARHDWLQPMLHARHGNDPRVPETIRANWREAGRQAAMTALVRHADLHDTVALLEASGLEPLALKGAWLAWHAYAQPQLRPMTDIDLLLTPETVLTAFEVLQRAGYVLIKPPEMPLADVVRIEKHLPPLRSPRGTAIELHHRLWEPDGRLDHASPDSDEAAVRSRAVQIGGIAYPCPEDMLVHLIVHGAYSHRLGCGPRVLGDLDVLVRRYPIDWEHFWNRSVLEGWRSGARLLLGLTTDYCDTPGVVLTSASGPTTPFAIRNSAPALLLQDGQTVASASAFAAVLARGPAALWDRLRGIRGARGEQAVGRDTTSQGGFAAWLTSRASRTLADALSPGVLGQSRDLARFSRWLGR